MQNKFLTIILYLLILSNTISQPTNSYLNDVILAPPSSASLGKFVDIPVNAHTGVPKIGVPMYTLQDGPIQVPVSLDYHASGIKVQEIASWVGLGWALNGGGIISRTILGKADEDINGGYWHSGDVLSDNLQSIADVGESVKDGEPDLFSFSFPGYSGKFILNKFNIPILIPRQDIVINVDFDASLNKFIRFTFIDPEGKKYIFGSPEGINNRIGVDSIKATSGQQNKFLPYQDQAWNLIEIKTTDNKYKISFEYDRDTYSYRSLASYNNDLTYCSSLSGSASSESSGSIGLPYTLSDNRVYLTMINTFSGRRLRKIITSTEYMLFNATTVRLDVDPNNDNSIKIAPSLDNIELYTNVTSPYKILRWRMGNSNYFTDGTVTQSVGKRLKLDSVWLEIFQGATPNHQVYRFKYLTTNNLLPHRLYSGVDHWGYNNGKGVVNTTNLNIPTTTVGPVTRGDAATNRNTDTAFAKQGVLNEIQYPTGGLTKFVYESNDYPKATGSPIVNNFLYISTCPTLTADCCFSNIPSIQWTMTAEQAAIGKFKIKLTAVDYDNTINTTGCSPNAVVKIWVTNSNNDTVSSEYGFNLDLNHQQHEKEISNLTWFHMDFDPDPGVTYRFHISATRGRGELTLYTEIPQGTIVNTYAGGLRVKEIRNVSNKDPDVVRTYEYKRPTGNTSSGKLYSNPVYGSMAAAQSVLYGSNVIEFTSESIVPMSSYDGYHISYSRVVEKTINNGQKIMDFDTTQSLTANSLPAIPALYTPGNGDLLKEEIKTQSNTVIKSELNTYLRPSGAIDGIFLKVKKIEFSCPGYGGAHVFFYSLYQPLTGTSVIGTKNTVIDGVSTSQSFNYNFNFHLQPVYSSTTNSNGQISVRQIKYIHDLTGGTLKTDLINRNLVLPAIQEDVLVSNTQVDGSKIEYKFFDAAGNPTTSVNIPYPYTFSKYRATETTPGQFTGEWIIEGTNNAYDMIQGKPKTFTARGWLPTTYTWQNGLIKTRTFKDHTVTYNYITGTRLLSSIIDKDGQTTNYFYDGILRLDSIRARNGNITNKFQYQYKNNLSSQNWIKSTSRYTAVTGSDLVIKEAIQYFDGLGRPIQFVKKEYSQGDKKDVSSALDYDEEGRVIKTYEPFKTANSTGAYTSIPPLTKFTSAVYEASMLERATSVTPPDWFPSNNFYGKNTNADQVGYYNGLSVSNVYPENTLFKSTQQDADGNKTITFSDKKSRVILQRKTNSAEQSTSFNDTYTLYDHKDRVKTIIPAGASLETPELIFGYTYDQFDNILSKKIPGQAKTEIVFNDRNLPTVFQNGLLLAQGRWLLNLYDDYGRMTESGFTNSPENPYVTSSLIQHFYDGFNGSTQISLTTNPQYTGRIRKSRFNNMNGIDAGTSWNQSEYSYDTYGRNTSTSMTNHIPAASDVVTNTYDFADQIVESARIHTAHASSNLAINRKFTFDHQGRAIKSTIQIGSGSIKTVGEQTYSIKDELSQNIIGGGLQTLDYSYNIQGWLTGINSSKTATDLFSEELKYFDSQVGSGFSGKKNGSISQQILETQGRQKQVYNFGYDYLDRLTSTSTGEFSGATFTLNNKFNETFSYDLRGNITTLTRKGEMPTGVGTFQNSTIDNLNYSYISNTNTLNSVTDALATCPAQYMITEGIHIPITISASQTLTADNTVDGSNVVQFTAGSSILMLPGFSTEAYGSGNFTASIQACGANKSNPEGFVQSIVNNYLYDVDGDLTYDPNKGLSMSYNYMHLPFVALNSSGCNRIEWVYDASGKKVQQKTFQKGLLMQTIDYLDGIEYRKQNTNPTSLDAIYFEEGRYIAITQKYEFILRDHLGNTRLSFIDSDNNGAISVSEITQESYYYTFGMTMPGPWVNNNTFKYQYNAKELNLDIGLDLYDYGARWYDASIARWSSVDPLADQRSWLTPYNYVQNNPLNRIDPIGALDDPIHDRETGEFLGHYNDSDFDGEIMLMDLETYLNLTEGKDIVISPTLAEENGTYLSDYVANDFDMASKDDRALLSNVFTSLIDQAYSEGLIDYNSSQLERGKFKIGDDWSVANYYPGSDGDQISANVHSVSLSQYQAGQRGGGTQSLFYLHHAGDAINILGVHEPLHRKYEGNANHPIIDRLVQKNRAYKIASNAYKQHVTNRIKRNK